MSYNPNEKDQSGNFPEEELPDNWTNPPTLSDLKTNLTDSNSKHSAHTAKVQEWLNNLRIEGSAVRKKITGRSNVQPKLIRKQAEWRYAALSEPFLATEDLFQVSPVTFEDKQSSIQNQLVLNHQFNNKINKVDFIDELVRTDVDEGTAIVRVGWESEEREEEKIIPVYEYYPAVNQAQIEELMPYAHMAQTDPETFKSVAPEHFQEAIRLTHQYGQAIYPKFIEDTVVTENVLVKNQPTLEVCDFNNTIIDPSCNGDMSKAEFVIHSFETNLSELNKAGLYTNLDKLKLSHASDVLSQPDHETSMTDGFNFKDEARKKIVAFEYWGYWDVDDSGITTSFVATWVGDVLIRLEENPYPFEGLPFAIATYLPVRKEVHGEPDGELLLDNQEIVGAVTRGAIDLMARSANSQKGMRKDALDSVNKHRYDKGEDYEFNPSIDPRQAIIEHTYPEIPNSVFSMLNLQNNEAESLSGVKAFTGGISGEALGDTATSVRGALDAASKRELGILRRLAGCVTQIGKMIIAMNAEFLSDREIIRVTNEKFVAINREELSGSFDLKLGISTAEEDNQKAGELSFMLQTMGNTMPREFSQMILADIARLRKMPDLAKKIENFQPQPDPIQQQIQLLELEKLKAEVGKLQSDAFKNTASGQADLAKAGETSAKASNIQSDTDQKNLDFLEQEAGIKHAREIAQNGEQARSNMALEILKADLANEKQTVS